MPLHPGTSSETQSQNISEMMKSKTFGKGKSRAKKHEMAIAASYRKKRESASLSRRALNK